MTSPWIAAFRPPLSKHGKYKFTMVKVVYVDEGLSTCRQRHEKPFDPKYPHFSLYPLEGETREHCIQRLKDLGILTLLTKPDGLKVYHLKALPEHLTLSKVNDNDHSL